MRQYLSSDCYLQKYSWLRNSRNVCLTALEVGKSKTELLADLVRTHFLVVVSLCGDSGGMRELPGVSSLRALIPFRRTLASGPHHF